jgi:hypothetical protein
MGMFNYVLYKGKEYQSKDFECLMTTYKIENDRLYEEKGHLELIPEDRRSHPWHISQWIHEGWEDMNYHGWLNFYDYDTDTNISTDYNAKFTDGELVSVNVETRSIT